MDKENGIYLAIKNKGIVLFSGNWMPFGITISNQTSQTQKDKYIYFLSFVNLRILLSYIKQHKHIYESGRETSESEEEEDSMADKYYQSKFHS